MIHPIRTTVAALAPLLLCLPAIAQEERLTPQVSQAHPILAIGSPAPDFSLPGIDGKTPHAERLQGVRSWW